MLQKRYEGFLNTPLLWKNNAIPNLPQFEITTKFQKINCVIDDSLRLGKYVERLVSFELQQHEHISILAENIQIQQHKITLGELDCILLKDKQPIHLEIIYKFYLYDASVGTSEIEHFIGPNRKDTLQEKLNKLLHKQLPILYTSECENYLGTLNLKPNQIKQNVYFKAQLFLPFTAQHIELKTLNTNCICGFYINAKQLQQFKDCKFFIPEKKDWLVQPHTHVNWINFNAFNGIVGDLVSKKNSALFWMKSKNGELQKVVLVWW